MIEVRSIRKTYGRLTALQEVSFEVPKGELFGIIGPDGAGKTTLLRILATVLLADSGEAKVDGLDVVLEYRAIRKKVGYMPGTFSLYPDLNVEENLHFFASIFRADIQANYDNIRSIYGALEPFRTRRAGALSGGMKQKLALSCALIHNPEVLFLDEPTTGVDAIARQEFWETLHELKSRGMTILVSTPYMDEASRCDRIALLQEGRLIGMGSPGDLVRRYPKALWGVQGKDTYRLLEVLKAFAHTDSCSLFGSQIHLSLKGGAADLPAVQTYLKDQGCGEAVLEPVSPLIEDCFIELMSVPQT